MSAAGLLCPTPQDTIAAGRQLAGELRPGDIVLLVGNLAAGKTTLVRGLVEGLGGDPEQVDSPTFVLVQTYPVSAAGLSAVHHVDLYRLGEALRDLREVGLEELLNDPEAVIAVEWPKHSLAAWIPAAARVVTVHVEAAADDTRRITIAG